MSGPTETHATAPRLTGGCQCGFVRYTARPERHEGGKGKGVVCHCRMCQRAVGAPYFAAFLVNHADLDWTTTAPETYQSSTVAVRGFCAKCGTSLTYHVVGTDRSAVTIASLDDPSAVHPAIALGVEAKCGWVDAVPNLKHITTDAAMSDRVRGLESRQYSPPATNAEMEANSS